jgi:Type II secretion system (T2SS), protein E, N-terminal domain
MNVPQDIPPQTLNEVFKTIAQRRDVDVSKVGRDSVDEEEFLAALAFNQGSPLIEECDLTEELLSLCRQHARELDPKGMAEYKFVPMSIRGQTLLVVSSCPWDPMMVEVISGYFPQCSQVRFALTSPVTLTQLLHQMQGEDATPMAGYTTSQTTAAVRPVAPTRLMAPNPPAVPPPTAPKPQPKAVVPPPPTGPCPSAGPVPPPLPPPSRTIPRPPEAARSSAPTDVNLLTTEDTTYLINLVVQEANKILARKRAGKH